VTAELNVAISIAGEAQRDSSPSSTKPRLAKLRLYGAPVDAGYTSKYNYQVTASSKITFRIVPVPPSPTAEQIRVAPNVVGKTVAEAREWLDRAFVSFVFRGGSTPPDSAKIAGQSIAPGELLTRGTPLEIWV
jgi:hypothetical protein